MAISHISFKNVKIFYVQGALPKVSYLEPYGNLTSIFSRYTIINLYFKFQFKMNMYHSDYHWNNERKLNIVWNILRPWGINNSQIFIHLTQIRSWSVFSCDEPNPEFQFKMPKVWYWDNEWKLWIVLNFISPRR